MLKFLKIFLISLLLTSCERENLNLNEIHGKATFVINKGLQYPKPNSNMFLHYNVNGMSSEVIFDENCYYDLKNDDQYDWNKLMGIYGGIDKNVSIRWAWRYSLKSKDIELSPFIHSNSKIGHIENCGRDFIHVKLNESFHLQIDIDKIHQRYIMTFTKYPFIKDVRIIEENFGNSYNKFCIRNFMWFGGTSVAPHKMSAMYNYRTY